MRDMDRDRYSARGPRVVGEAVFGSGCSSQGRLFLGLGLVMFGLLWTLQGMGWRPADELVRWWPLLLVGYGVSTLSGWGGPRSLPRGLFFTGLGTLLVLAHLVHISVGFGVVWSLIVLFAGVMLLWRTFAPDHDDASPGTAGADSPLKMYAILGASIRRATGQAPTRGELFAMMGGIELDLRQVVPPSGPLVLDVFACAGGVEVIVPATWRVLSDIMPVAGAVEDRTTHTAEGAAEATLELRGTVIMGGVVVRNTPGADREVVIRRRRVRRGGVDEIHVSPLGVRIKRSPAPGTTGAGPAADEGPEAGASGEPSIRTRRIRLAVRDAAVPIAANVVLAVVGVVAILALVWLARHHEPPATFPGGAPPASSSAPQVPAGRH